MLEVGNGGMTNAEYRTHMSLWALLAAPLLAGNDLRSMSPDTLAILANRGVIAIDQDPLGRQGHRIRADDSTEVWERPLASGAHAIGLFNRSASSVRVDVRWSELGLTGKHVVHEVWSDKGAGSVEGGYAADVEPHGVVLIRVGR
jgi:alpha-galactosidase